MPRRELPEHWTPLPGGFPDAPRVRALLDEFGPTGPYVLVVLIATAVRARHMGAEPGTGRFAWGDFTDAVKPHEGADVRAVLVRLHEIDLLDSYEADLYGFRYRLAEWDEWDLMPKDPGAAERQRKRRKKAHDAATPAPSSRPAWLTDEEAVDGFIAAVDADGIAPFGVEIEDVTYGLVDDADDRRAVARLRSWIATQGAPVAVLGYPRVAIATADPRWSSRVSVPDRDSKLSQLPAGFVQLLTETADALEATGVIAQEA